MLAECGQSREDLKKQWAEQVQVQTKPVARMYCVLVCGNVALIICVGRSKTRGQKAVAAVLAARTAKGICKTRVDDCTAEALEACGNEDRAAIALTKDALKAARTALEKATSDLKRKEEALGVTDRQELKKQQHTKFFELRMNARAVKVQLRDSLRSRKFELSRAERISRRHLQECKRSTRFALESRLTPLTVQGIPRNEQKLQTHTEAAVKKRQGKINKQKNVYNTLCDLMAKEIQQRRAPSGAIVPDKIKSNDVYNLDVDDAIWQDIGLDDERDGENALPPGWLADTEVRRGIQAVLQLDRADEEDAILLKEQSSMRRWFTEEWEVLEAAMAKASM